MSTKIEWDSQLPYYDDNEFSEDGFQLGVTHSNLTTTIIPRETVTSSKLHSLVDLYKKGVPPREALKQLSLTEQALDEAPKKLKDLYLQLIEDSRLTGEERRQLSRSLTDKIAFTATQDKDYTNALEALKLINQDPEVNLLPSYLQPPTMNPSLQGALSEVFSKLGNAADPSLLEGKVEVLDVDVIVDHQEDLSVSSSKDEPTSPDSSVK